MKLDAGQELALRSFRAGTRRVVYACPGAGKTRLLVEAAGRLALAGQRVALVSYTQAAAREIAERLNPELRPRYVGTLHALCLRLVGGAVATEDEALAEAQRAADDMGVRVPRKALEQAMEMVPELGVGQLPSGYQGALLPAREAIRRLRTRGLHTFTGLLASAAEALRKCCAEWPYDVLLWDEAQDSGTLDYRVMDAVPPDCAILAVGDPTQSIYGFRGAKPETFGALGRERGWEERELGVNYRSSQNLVIYANALRALDGGWAPMESRLGAPAGSLRLDRWRDEPAEAEGIATQVLDMVRQGVAPGDMAVLCRTNRHSDWLRDALAARRVLVAKAPPRLQGRDNRVALTLAVRACADHGSVLRAVSAIAGEDQARRIERQAALSMREPWEVLGMPEIKAAADLTTALRRLGVQNQDVDWALEWLRDQPVDRLTLLSLAAAAAEQEEIETGGRPGVAVRTLHGAKGCEWDHVWIAGLEQGNIPLSRGSVAEERRLLYVGITRARHSVALSWCERRVSQWHQEQETEPSEFLVELGLGEAVKQERDQKS